MNRILIVGPYASEYSIAKVNRNMGLYLSKLGCEVKYYANEKYTDRLASKDDIKRYPFLKGMESKENLDSDIILFYNFPKSIYAKYGLSDLKGSLKLAYLGWEESSYPERLVEECNRELNAVAAISNHVKGVFRRSGIKLPIKVINHGLDLVHAESETYSLKTNKRFWIYHNSSGQYRKGLDLLIKAYLDTFTKDDDVVLILKLYPNQSQDKQALKLIEDNKEGPEVIVINDGNVTDGQMRHLAGSSHLHVYPARAEGFGLPIAEALALGKALITTCYSGQMDFVSHDNAFLLNYKMSNSMSHLNIPGSMVAEPDLDELKRTMRYVYDNYDSDDVQTRMRNGILVKEQLSWDKAASEMFDLIKDTQGINELKQKKLSVVSTYNSNCGIAIYSGDLYERVIGEFKSFNVYANSDISSLIGKDPSFVKRVWNLSENNFSKLNKQILEDKPDYIHIQYNTSFYSPLRLSQLLSFCISNDIKCIVTLHLVNDSLKDIKEVLDRTDLIIVHSDSDAKKLNEMGIKNVEVMHHGLPYFPDTDTFKLQKSLGLENRRVIATHGLIHDKKGFLELCESITILKKEFPNIFLLMLTAINPDNSTSRIVYERIKRLIKENELEGNVMIITEFLESPLVIKLLQASELIVLPYSDVAEGASGALKYALSSHRPILITNSYIFGGIDLPNKLKDNSKETIALEISRSLKHNELLIKNKQKVEEYIKEYDWDDIAIKYLKSISRI